MAEVAAERKRRWERKQRHRLIRERFQEVKAEQADWIHNLGLGGVFDTSIRTGRRESRDSRGIGKSDGGRVQES